MLIISKGKIKPALRRLRSDAIRRSLESAGGLSYQRQSRRAKDTGVLGSVG